METLLNVKNLSVGYYGDTGRDVAVDTVSFSVARGEILCIVGESGCGKSLTSLAVGGLVERAEITGKIEFAGNVSGDNGISYIFQNPMHRGYYFFLRLSRGSLFKADFFCCL